MGRFRLNPLKFILNSSGEPTGSKDTKYVWENMQQLCMRHQEHMVEWIILPIISIIELSKACWNGRFSLFMEF